MSEALEESFKTLIDALGLPVGLWVVGSAHPKLSTSMAEKFLPKMACEDRITVGNNGLREPMDGIDALHVEKSHSRSSIWVGEWKEMSKFGHFVDQNPNAVCLT